jgi:aminotransferase EvaB
LHATPAIPVNDLRRAVLPDEELVMAVERVTRSGWYLLGEETAAFEGELGNYLGVAHVVGVASGSDALELSFAALEGSGQELVTAANAGGYATLAARRRGMQVRFADVEDRDLLVSRRTIERALTPRTAIVVVTHLYGKMAPVLEICELCHRHGIKVVEDCAQAAGAHVGDRYAGSFGDASTFSFYPTKNLGALGDGGAVVSADEQLAARVRRLRQYGWEEKYRVVEDGGCNSRLDELQAAVLRVRLGRLDENNARRRAILARYASALSANATTMAQDCYGPNHVAHLAVLRTPRRAALAKRLRQLGVATEVHYPIPDHHQPMIGTPSLELPVTEAACGEVLTLPCFPELENEEVEFVCQALGEAVESL